MSKLSVARQRIAQINLGGRMLAESAGDINDDASAEAAGVELSKRCHWSGDLILLAAGAALEDANFHSEAAIVRKMAEDL
jgi:hypothetical protein